MTDLSGYFDYAAATPVDERVLAAMQPFYTDTFFNPSANYAPARNAKQSLNQARANVASLLGVRSPEIIFTAGGTESNNLAIHGIMRQFPGANIIFSAIEHESVRVPAKAYEARECPVQKNGIVDIDDLIRLIDEHTVLVSVMLANNEIGTIQPVRQISQRLESIRSQRKQSGNTLPLLFHTDAAQAANYLDLHINRLGVDLLSLNGGKIYGPKQTGVLYVRGGLVLQPLIQGGGQESNLRSGTENIAGAVGFAKALEITSEMRREETERLSKLQKTFFELVEQKIPQAIVNGSQKHRLPNNIHITIEGQDNERLLMLLDEKGIYAAAGSACSASRDEPSHVLTAVGLNTEQIQSSLRFTMGRYTQESDISRSVGTLAAVLA